MTTRTAGPDYWFVDPAYDGIDRLTDDECPMDEVEQAQFAELRAAESHSHHCLHALSFGDHTAENCPAGGV